MTVSGGSGAASAPPSTLVLAPKTRSPPGVECSLCDKLFGSTRAMNRHKRACGTAQTQACLVDSVEPCAWVLIRCADVAERTWTRAVDAGFLVTHEEALGHIQHLPRGAGVAIAQVQSYSPDAATRTFTVKFEQVILTAQTKKSTFMRSDTETTQLAAMAMRAAVKPIAESASTRRTSATPSPTLQHAHQAIDPSDLRASAHSVSGAGSRPA
ncbi:hypothetical protein T492DRAFT_886102 [Pavlovales sp. CCMP2436]|nr:hypothetical protein T492DRAFT_886102 [Pavlovales sp. CCMP2436]